MDLKNFSVDPENQTATMDVLHPKTGEALRGEDGEKVTITLHGPDSDVLKGIERGWTNKYLKDGQKNRRTNITAEQIEAKALSLDVAATAAWENLAFDGEDLECNPKNARMVYTKLPWLKEQVEEFFNDRANFLGN